jgi:hypothetical protein
MSRLRRYCTAALLEPSAWNCYAVKRFVFDVNGEPSWPILADKIIRKHID